MAPRFRERVIVGGEIKVSTCENIPTGPYSEGLRAIAQSVRTKARDARLSGPSLLASSHTSSPLRTSLPTVGTQKKVVEDVSKHDSLVSHSQHNASFTSDDRLFGDLVRTDSLVVTVQCSGGLT